MKAEPKYKEAMEVFVKERRRKAGSVRREEVTIHWNEDVKIWWNDVNERREMTGIGREGWNLKRRNEVSESYYWNSYHVKKRRAITIEDSIPIYWRMKLNYMKYKWQRK